MLDTAVTWFGVTIENALEERVKEGWGAKETYKPRYTLTRLLDERFRLPKPAPEPVLDMNPWAPFMAWMGKPRSGIKRYRYEKPVD